MQGDLVLSGLLVLSVLTGLVTARAWLAADTDPLVTPSHPSILTAANRKSGDENE